MAYQPKSYRKFVATAATATLVASAVAPAALAASSFKDVADKYKEAVDYLFDNGITNGKTEELFGTHDNIKRGELAIWLTRALGLEEAAKEAAPSGFADVAGTYYDGYVSVLKEEGILDGKSSKEFGVNDYLTRGQMAKLLSNAYGLVSEEEAPFEDKGQWAEFIDGLYAYGITQGKTEDTFGSSEYIKRGDIAIFLFRADTLPGEEDLVAPEFNYDGETELSIENGAEFVLPEVTATDDVDGELELTPVITDAEGNEVALEDIDTTVAATYTVTYTAVDAAGNEATLELTVEVAEAVVVAPAVESVSAIDVNKIDVKFNGAVDSEAATFKLKKGAVVYPVTVKWNEEKSVATLTTAIELPKGEYTVEVSGLTEDVLSMDTEILEETVSSLELSSDSVQISDNSTIEFAVLNQYGTDMEVSSTTAGLTFAAYNVTEKAPVTVTTVAGESEIKFTQLATDGAEVGDEIRVTLNYKGITVQKTIVVTDAIAAGDFEFGNVVIPENQVRIYAGDTNVQIEYSLFDQFGGELELTSGLTGASAIASTDGVTITSSNHSVVDPANIDTDADGNLVFEAGADGTATLTAIINATGDVATVTVDVSEVKAVDSFDVVSPSELVVQGEATKVSYVAADQYGAVYALEDFDAAEQGQLTFVSSDDTIVDDSSDITFNEDNELVITPSGNGEVTIDVKIGTETVATLDLDVQATAVAQQITAASFPTVFEVGSSLQLDNDDLTVVDQYGREFEGPITINSDTNGVVTDSGDDTITAAGTGTATLTITVGTKTIDVDVEVIASADIESYTLEDFGTVYASNTGAYDVAAVLNGVDADGNKVVLADTAPDFITSSNTNVAKVVNDVEVQGVDAGTATITAWKDGVKVATATVTVSEAAPVATSVDLDNTSTLADGSNVTTLVTVLDQYGVDITGSTTLFFTGGTVIGTNGATANDAADAGNVTETITVVTSNGLTDTAEVIVVDDEAVVTP